MFLSILHTCITSADTGISGLQVTMAAAAAGRPWAAEAIEVLICGGIDAFWLAQAEAAAQEATPSTALSAAQLDASIPHAVWSAAAVILHEAAAGITPQAARALAKRGAAEGGLLYQTPLYDASACVHLQG